MRRRLLADLLDSGDPDAGLNEVSTLMASAVPGLNPALILRCYRVMESLYAGRFPGYRPCNTAYHDFRHAAGVFLAMARLIHGSFLNSETLTEKEAWIALAAAGLHDAGYIQETGDLWGTGAKYKSDHEERGIRWLANHAAEVGLTESEAESVGNLIRCTRVSAGISDAPLPDDRERRLGSMLGAADLLAQLSDQVYLEKLTFLFAEDQESGRPAYGSIGDALIGALDFYGVFRERLPQALPDHEELLQTHFARRWGIDRNLYREAIAGHHLYLSEILQAPRPTWLGRLRRRRSLHLAR